MYHELHSILEFIMNLYTLYRGSYTSVEKKRAALIIESTFQTICYGTQHSTKVDLEFLEAVLQIRQRSSLCINNAIRS
jgi:hypothetical protein